MENILLFILAVLALMVVPGPDMAYVIANGMTYGKKGALYSALGIGCGGLILTLVLWTVLYFTLSLQNDALVYIQYAGAAYMLYLAYKILSETSDNDELIFKEISGSLFFRGIVTNISNPKVIIFFMAFIPSFIPPDTENPALYAAMLGVILCIIGTTINFGFGITGLYLGKLVKIRIAGRNLAQYILSSVFIFVAVSILVFNYLN